MAGFEAVEWGRHRFTFAACRVGQAPELDSRRKLGLIIPDAKAVTSSAR
jgi:hypothetical protein